MLEDRITDDFVGDVYRTALSLRICCDGYRFGSEGVPVCVRDGDGLIVLPSDNNPRLADVACAEH